MESHSSIKLIKISEKSTQGKLNEIKSYEIMKK